MNQKLAPALAALALMMAAGCAPPPEQNEARQPSRDEVARDNSFFAVNPPVEAPTKELPDRPLLCDLQAKPGYQRDERVEISFRLTNKGQRPLWVLRWNTPFEGLVGDCFEIYHDDDVVFFQGRMVKRAMPEASEYVLIPPGESREGRVDLRAAYKVEEPGTYSLHFDSALFDVVDDESLLPRKLEDHQPFDPKCPPVVFEVR